MLTDTEFAKAEEKAKALGQTAGSDQAVIAARLLHIDAAWRCVRVHVDDVRGDVGAEWWDFFDAPAPLSGEWAGDWTSQALCAAVGLRDGEDGERDKVCDVFTEFYYDTFRSVLVNMARVIVRTWLDNVK